MRKSTIIKISVAAALAVGAAQPWEAVRAHLDGSAPAPAAAEEMAIPPAATEGAVGETAAPNGGATWGAPKKKGNGFANDHTARSSRFTSPPRRANGRARAVLWAAAPRPADRRGIGS